MAAFPSVAPDYGSTESWRDPLLIDVSKSGALRGRRLQPTKKLTFNLQYKNLSDANRNTIQSHYDTHRTGVSATFSFTWADSASSYTVAYASEPTWTKSAYGRWDGNVTLMEV